MPQHQDPVVYNATVGTWQNASNSGPSGAAIGMTIGDPAGSQVSMVPSQGQTLTVDGTDVWTVQAAMQYATNTGSEVLPGYSCALVLNAGAANETLAMMHLSSMSVEGMATLMASMSADGLVHGYISTGLLQASGGGWSFSTVQTLSSQAAGGTAGQHLLAKGWGLFGTDPHTNVLAVWRHFTDLASGLPRAGFSDAGSSTEFSPQYHYSPLHNGMAFFRGVVQCPTNPNGTTFTTLPSELQIANSCRYPISLVGSSQGNQGGYVFIGETGDMSFHGVSTTVVTPTIDITGNIHLGSSV